MFHVLGTGSPNKYSTCMLFFSASASIRKGPCQFVENFPSVCLTSLFILQTKSPWWNFLDLTLELYLRDMLCFAAAS